MLYDKQTNRRTPPVFNFDYVFPSSDEPGLKQSQDWSQQEVYHSIGQPALDEVWSGYNCCIVALGGACSGKRYSMFGPDLQSGLVPMFVEELFQRIDSSSAQSTVMVSICDINFERVNDLLVDINQRPHYGLRVREDKKRGIFIQNLTQQQITNSDEFRQCLSTAQENQCIHFTRMSILSTHAHMLVTLHLKQKTGVGSGTMKIKSVVQFVILAGTDSIWILKKQPRENFRPGRWMETLQVCVNTLAQKSLNQASRVFAPYRNSVITRLLTQSLGGNSKSTILVTIPPSGNRYEDTLWRLDLASTARHIRNKALINFSFNHSGLHQEVDALRSSLSATLAHSLHDKSYQGATELAKLSTLVEEANFFSRYLQTSSQFRLNSGPSLRIEEVNSEDQVLNDWPTHEFPQCLYNLRDAASRHGNWDQATELGKAFFAFNDCDRNYSRPVVAEILDQNSCSVGYLQLKVELRDDLRLQLQPSSYLERHYMGHPLHFRVEIGRAWLLPQNSFAEFRCVFSMPGLGSQRTNPALGYFGCPVFNYCEEFTDVLVDEPLLEFLWTQPLVISVCGV